MLRPVTDTDGAPFWEYAARGELRIQACAGCGELRFPPRPCCPHCQSFAADWRRMSGRGRVWSYVVAHPPLLPDYAALAPYNVVVVALDEAPRIRLVGNLVAEPGAALGSLPAGRLRIGARVQVAFAGGLPRWVPERP
ncbi:OB-fold domain-containing protein [Streptomyces sp. DSM 41921]|uniref:OB-fold domain-containing protein n=1 Tax=Streptomyces dubilierae TaxID=3075533 RepID=A0ABU2P8E6_9ACTN|nr:OB-fold domain-containing protein [Streptomyces sp. DSM 41921]MDT0388423.1 OB-fold domain-containing protein [Streptomyces sp. DSM 41921]